MNWIIENARVVTEQGVAHRDLYLEDGHIAETPPKTARRFDATGLTAAPGIIDLHGDGFERSLSPRSGVFFDLSTALIDTDRQLIANGITTAYLAMTISWEPGLRSLARAREIVEALTRLRPHLIADIRLQLRWEVFALDAADDVENWLTLDPKPTIAFNDHFSLLFDPASRVRKDLEKYADRSGISVEEYQRLIDRTDARRTDVPSAMERLAKAAVSAGVPCFAHDEMDAETRKRNRALGITVSEFPLNRAAAAEAVAHDEPTVLGAPNVVRGCSHIGALGAEDAAKEGLCSALASDYYYPSQFAAAMRLIKQSNWAATDAWSLISAGPARAVGLEDRGTLSPGALGDVVLYDAQSGPAFIDSVFRKGAPVFTATPTRMAN